MLIESDPKAVRRVIDTRMEVLEEEKRKAEGKEPGKRNLVRKFNDRGCLLPADCEENEESAHELSLIHI